MVNSAGLTQKQWNAPGHFFQRRVAGSLIVPETSTGTHKPVNETSPRQQALSTGHAGGCGHILAITRIHLTRSILSASPTISIVFSRLLAVGTGGFACVAGTEVLAFF